MHIKMLEGLLTDETLSYDEEQALHAAIAALAQQAGAVEVIALLREYKREYDNPAPDYTYRHLLRESLFKAIASSGPGGGGEGGNDR